MKKTLIVIACLFLSLMLFACTSSSEKSKDDKSNQNQETGTSPDIKETINDDPSDFLTAPYKAKAVEDMEIYSDTSEDSLLKGYVRSGDVFEIYETSQTEDGIWCRIAKDFWIKNNGDSSLEKIPYNTDIDYIHDEISFDSALDCQTAVYYERYNDGIPISGERDHADSVETEYDDEGRIVTETLYLTYYGGHQEKKIYQYKYEPDNTIYVKIDSYYDDGGRGYDELFIFTFDEKGRLLTESISDGSSGNILQTITHEYNEKGNIILLGRESDNPYISDEIFEYNGNIRFQYSSKVDEDDDYTKETIVYRYDSESNKIERFFASMGDIRNDLGPRK